MTVEVLRLAGSIATPLGLVAFLFSLVFIAHLRRQRRIIDALKGLPESERLEALNSSLARYKIDGANLTKDQRFLLILRELEAKERQHARICRAVVLISAVLIIGGLVAFVWSKQIPDPPPPPPRPALVFTFEPVNVDLELRDVPLERDWQYRLWIGNGSDSEVKTIDIRIPRLVGDTSIRCRHEGSYITNDEGNWVSSGSTFVYPASNSPVRLLLRELPAKTAIPIDVGIRGKRSPKPEELPIVIYSSEGEFKKVTPNEWAAMGWKSD